MSWHRSDSDPHQFIYGKTRKKGDKIRGVIDEKKRSFRKYKFLPKGCKTAKRICIKCLTTTIHKNDLNYESKICKSCTNPSALSLASRTN